MMRGEAAELSYNTLVLGPSEVIVPDKRVLHLWQNRGIWVYAGSGPALAPGPRVYSAGACRVGNAAHSFHSSMLCQCGENVGRLILVS